MYLLQRRYDTSSNLIEQSYMVHPVKRGGYLGNCANKQLHLDKKALQKNKNNFDKWMS
jgi:hypothetical protein